jgi:hypothetical protein
MRKKMRWSKICLIAFLASILPSLAALADAEPEPAPAVPEPTSWLLFGVGALGVGWAVRRRRRS